MQLYSVDSKCSQRAVNTASLSELCTPSIKVKNTQRTINDPLHHKLNHSLIKEAKSDFSYKQMFD